MGVFKYSDFISFIVFSSIKILKLTKKKKHTALVQGKEKQDLDKTGFGHTT